jgi:anti-repressor protein
MSNQLIPTITGEIAGEFQPLVNARDLHRFLGTGKDFTNWIKKRIDEYRFTEGRDFSPILAKTSSEFGGRPKTEYHLTLRMAEHLAMVEKSKRGQQVRDYFIEMEKRAQGRAALSDNVRHELLTARPLWAKIQRYFALGLNGKEIALLLRCNITTVRKHRRRMEACGLLTPPANLAKLQQSGLRLINGGAK